MSTPAAPTLLRRNAAWWLRWLLVLLLVFDQVSAPLHRHHHHAGVDAVGTSPGHSQADHHAGLDLDQDDDGDGQTAHHASGGLRSAPGASVQATDAGPDAAAFAIYWSVAAWFAQLAPVPERTWRLALALDRPSRPVPLSRPPDGRAPPVRA